MRSREEKETKMRTNKDSRGRTNEMASGRKEGKVGGHIPERNRGKTFKKRVLSWANCHTPVALDQLSEVLRMLSKNEMTLGPRVEPFQCGRG